MNHVVGGSLFARQISEYIVNEAIKQEGHAKYNERIDRLKRIPDYLMDLVILPFWICSLLVKLLKVIAYVISFILVCFTAVYVVSVGFFVMQGYSYTIENYGACTLDMNKSWVRMHENAGVIELAKLCKLFHTIFLGNYKFTALLQSIDSSISSPHFFVPSIMDIPVLFAKIRELTEKERSDIKIIKKLK
jgi:hypothetical protein